jgi:biotin carboxyl carrier protein
MKRLRVTVEGKVYEVLVEMLDETGASAGAFAPSAAVPGSAGVAAPAAAAVDVSPAPAAAKRAPGANDIVSPLAGKVVSIDVKSGQSVNEGTQVATLEAMKMNTYVYAPHAGRVTEVVANAACSCGSRERDARRA